MKLTYENKIQNGNFIAQKLDHYNFNRSGILTRFTHCRSLHREFLNYDSDCLDYQGNPNLDYPENPPGSDLNHCFKLP